MSDVDVYCFVEWRCNLEENVRSKRAARLDVIREKGQPIADSLRIVDESELDLDGFLKTECCTEGKPRVAALAALENSLARRAIARVLLIEQLSTGGHDAQVAILKAQASELRAEAAALRAERARLEGEGNSAKAV